MASRLPSYILKDFSLAVGDLGNTIGRVSEVTVPVLAKTTETFRNAGMLKPREITMGYEVTSMSFRGTSLEPGMFELYGLGKASSLIVYGYLESEDGTTHALRFEIVADVKTLDMGSFASASKQETNVDLAVHSAVFFIDDEEVIAFDDFSLRVRGQEQMPGRRAALRLD